MTERRVMVTGGRGFIGRYVCHRLEELGIRGVEFDNDEKWGGRVQDVRDKEAIFAWAQNQDHPIEGIIHLAGMLGTHELWDERDAAIDVNIKGALNVADLALELDIPMVSIEQPHIWYNVYEASKLAAKRMLRGLHYDRGLKINFVTAHNAFGPGQLYGEGHPQKIIPTFATMAWNGKPIPIWGDGRQQVNLIYAGDVADKLVSSLFTHPRPEAELHAGTGQLFTVRQVANMVRDHVQKLGGPDDVELEFLPSRPGEQNKFKYPTPNELYRYKMKGWQLEQTVLSYKPQ